jgi:hypothetical protein
MDDDLHFHKELAVFRQNHGDMYKYNHYAVYFSYELFSFWLKKKKVNFEIG